MDAMLEEEMIDLITFCLQNPNSGEIQGKKSRISEIGKTLYLDGGVDAMENMFFAIQNRITEEKVKTQNPLDLYGMKILKNESIKPRNLIN